MWLGTLTAVAVLWWWNKCGWPAARFAYIDCKEKGLPTPLALFLAGISWSTWPLWAVVGFYLSRRHEDATGD